MSEPSPASLPLEDLVRRLEVLEFENMLIQRCLKKYERREGRTIRAYDGTVSDLQYCIERERKIESKTAKS